MSNLPDPYGWFGQATLDAISEAIGAAAPLTENRQIREIHLPPSVLRRDGIKIWGYICRQAERLEPDRGQIVSEGRAPYDFIVPPRR